MKFTVGEIKGVIGKYPVINTDDRGWLVEFFRSDELLASVSPVMAYISGTKPSIIRGPHMHLYQTDYFCFLGVGNFNLYLWDNRPESETYQHMQVWVCNEPCIVVVPPGVVHAYKNCSKILVGLVLNLPDKLYAGVGKSERVDEVRFENDPDSPFKVQENSSGF